MIELHLRVSCQVFWDYEMKININEAEYTEDDNNLNNGCCVHCQSPVFLRLERFLCDSMISQIHEDLAMKGLDAKILQLSDLSSKYHIHGQTTNSILNSNTNPVYICSHC
jgi:hypothetical protein